MAKRTKDVLAPKSFKGDLQTRSRRRRASLRSTVADASGFGVRNNILPDLELIEVATSTLKIPSRNVRAIDEEHLRDVMRSIVSLGNCVPVLIDQDDSIVDGVVRLLAAQRLNLSKIPCIRVSHLTRSQRKLLRLAINRLGEKGRWEFAELKLELKELMLDGAPIEVAGFSAIEIDQIGSEEEPPIFERGPLEPKAGVRAVAQNGDVFELGNHVIMCGDATQSETVAVVMSGTKARVVLTDQPYNVPIVGHVTGQESREFIMASGELSEAEFAKFNTAWISASIAHLCDGGVLGTFIDWRGYASVALAAVGLNLIPLNLIVWAKTNAGMGSLYRSQHELCPLFKQGIIPHVNNVSLGRHGRWRSNLWQYPGASSVSSDARKGLQFHPTIKPVAMLEDALLDLSNTDEIVLDPFLGSGSMLIAAEKCGRRCRGIELDPLYVDVAINRYREITATEVQLRETGESFEELKKRRGANSQSLGPSSMGLPTSFHPDVLSGAGVAEERCMPWCVRLMMCGALG